MDWMKLKSGSDVRGKAVGDGAAITDRVSMALGMAFVLFLAEKEHKPAASIRIALGRDSRITGEELLRAAEEGILRAGASAVDFGLCTTPAMFMALVTPELPLDGTIMITASHHPWDRNGLKFFTKDGGIESEDVETLLRSAKDLHPEESEISGDSEKYDFLPVYSDLLADRIRQGLETKGDRPLSGLHAVVDAGNGAGGFYAKLLADLGADTAGSQFLEPDGMFPNHIPNPENQEAIESLRSAVVRSGADIGVIFDTDCDRAAVVDADGREINRNRLIALISGILLKNRPGQTIVTDSVTSSGLKRYIEERGGTHYRYRRGYRNVINEAVRLNKAGIPCPLAIETSGHAALQENYFLDDGMYLVTLLIVQAMKMKKEGHTLGSLIEDLREPVESSEIRLNILEPDFRTCGENVIQSLLAYASKDDAWHVAPDNREGVRISFDLNGVPDSGWFLLRLSVHDPVLPLNCESDTAGGVREMLNRMYQAVKDVPGVDWTPILQAAGEN